MDLKNRFEYHPPKSETTKLKHETVREILYSAASNLNHIVPPGREASLVITKLEEAMFWANAGIARCNDEVVEV